jgi:cellulose synthase/poly-beta-1,6-N-acetylglucosamine synthase-like glycosyltransferase
LIGFVHTLCVVALSIYGIQAILLTVLYLRHRGEVSVGRQPDEEDWPLVAIQLPVYNELHVVERLIDAAAALDYPAGRLEVQVLDDSTDNTTQLAEARASHHRARGVNVRVLRRPTREGFKAGALAWGLQQTTAEFLAVFDADFSPRPDFLRKTIPQLLALPQVGVVQTRWSHLNETYSPLTRLQALALDGHFVVEQTGRCRSNLLINFNGSGGVWRRSCVEEAGGWQWDTMTEDMDLSYPRWRRSSGNRRGGHRDQPSAFASLVHGFSGVI